MEQKKLEENKNQNEKITNTPENAENKNTDNFVYFMTAYEKSKEYKIYLPQEYKDSEIEKIEEISEEKNNFILIIKIYRFKIIFDNLDKGHQIPVIMEEEDQSKHQYIIKLGNLKKDFYEYNFIIEKIDVLPLKYEI